MLGQPNFFDTTKHFSGYLVAIKSWISYIYNQVPLYCIIMQVLYNYANIQLYLSTCHTRCKSLGARSVRNALLGIWISIEPYWVNISSMRYKYFRWKTFILNMHYRFLFFIVYMEQSNFNNKKKKAFFSFVEKKSSYLKKRSHHILNIFPIFFLVRFLVKVFVPYIDSDLNMDTLNIFKSNKFYRHMALHVCEEKHLKR